MLINPVQANSFQVFLFDASPTGDLLPQSWGEAGLAAASTAIGVGKTVLFGSFSQASGLDQEIEVEEYREGGSNRGPGRFAKWGRYSNVTFRRGVTYNPDLTDWSYQVLNGSKAPIRKNGLVLLTDRGGFLEGEGTGLSIPFLDVKPVAAWFFLNGLPERIRGPELNATANEIAIETLEINHEGLMRLGPGMVPGIGEPLTQIGL